MRFSAANYEKAFPRKEKPAPTAPSDYGNVIEEAEKVIKKDPNDMPGNVIEEAPEADPEEGVADGTGDNE